MKLWYIYILHISYVYTMKYYSAIKVMKQCHLKQYGWTTE